MTNKINNYFMKLKHQVDDQLQCMQVEYLTYCMTNPLTQNQRNSPAYLSFLSKNIEAAPGIN